MSGPEMVHCSSCGATIFKDDKYCRYCGADVRRFEQSIFTEHVEKKIDIARIKEVDYKSEKLKLEKKKLFLDRLLPLLIPLGFLLIYLVFRIIMFL